MGFFSTFKRDNMLFQITHPQMRYCTKMVEVIIGFGCEMTEMNQRCKREERNTRSPLAFRRVKEVFQKFQCTHSGRMEIHEPTTA